MSPYILPKDDLSTRHILGVYPPKIIIKIPKSWNNDDKISHLSEASIYILVPAMKIC